MSLEGSKILITGAKGMLGHALQDVFADLKPVTADLEQLDITDKSAVDKYIDDLHPDLIINAAAYTNVDQCETDREACFKVNEQGPANLSQAAAKIGAKIVHYSTDYVFPGTKSEGYVESDETDPINAYGASKLAGEKALQNSNAQYFILRTAWLFGPHGKNFVDTMIKLGQEKDKLTVIDDQTGSPTYTYDLARTTYDLLAGDYESGIYHATNSEQTTWCKFAQEALRLKDIKTPVEPITTDQYPTPAKRPQFSVLTNTKLPELRSWKEALETYLKYN
ncbi:dTDP-4-dehydrorhamnose reductase [Patescibacteria group bacterium]